MSTEDDEPAFPWGEHGTHLGGMTLRDYFAAKIVCSFIENAAHGTEFGKGHDINNDIYASAAYIVADAMLKARK